MDAATLASEVTDAGRAAGLGAVGIASAEPFTATRRTLEERRAAGLHGGMAFTYRNPARATDPSATLPGARSLVVGAWAYDVPLPARPAAGGAWARVARYAWHDHYGALRGALDVVAGVLRGHGHRARVLVDDNALVDRAAAHRAGLGWFGKSANLLLPGRGSWFVLGSVLTDAELPVAAAPVADGCGPCRRCLDACPTGAIVAPGVVDARRCLAWLLQADGPFPRQHRAALGDRIYGCDDCQEVCPPSVRAERAGADRTRPTGVGAAWVELVDLLAASDEELLARHGRWYVPRRQPRYLRRNALVALGASAAGGDPLVAGALRAALADADQLVRAHAVWAAARLGRGDLLRAMAADPDPDVRAELAAAGRATGAAP
ncbi:MAG: tRNA epoxyqueuosine(34) reductase QueG [Acidimicrobiales bacterium]|nr:tRNA epoxyqueuosine(34) reductase QueG [Acidimicrobiales bacterium]